MLNNMLEVWYFYLIMHILVPLTIIMCTIPIIYIENNCTTESSQCSPPGRRLPTFMSDSEFPADRDLSLNNQVCVILLTYRL